MDSASVSLSEAQSNLSRMQILYNSGDLSDQEYEQYSNQVKSARLQYESAKLAYEKQVEYFGKVPGYRRYLVITNDSMDRIRIS